MSIDFHRQVTFLFVFFFGECRGCLIDCLCVCLYVAFDAVGCGSL